MNIKTPDTGLSGVFPFSGEHVSKDENKNRPLERFLDCCVRLICNLSIQLNHAAGPASAEVTAASMCS